MPCMLIELTPMCATNAAHTAQPASCPVTTVQGMTASRHPTLKDFTPANSDLAVNEHRKCCSPPVHVLPIAFNLPWHRMMLLNCDGMLHEAQHSLCSSLIESKRLCWCCIHPPSIYLRLWVQLTCQHRHRLATGAFSLSCSALGP